MRLALLVLISLLPVSAHAAPVVVAIAAYFAVSVATVVLVTATIVLTVGTAIYGSAQAKKAARMAKDQARASMQDRMVTRIATESPHRYVYGRARVGSDVVAMFTSGANDGLRHIVCVHAAHECDAIEEIYVNNEPLGPLDVNGNVTSGKYYANGKAESVTEFHTGPVFVLARTPIAGAVRVVTAAGRRGSSSISNSVSGNTVTIASAAVVTVIYQSLSAGLSKVNVQKHLGAPGSPADAYLRSLIPTQWPASATLNGLCYTVITLVLDVPEFQGGMVPIQALIRGRKMLDPRDGIKRWSANPALAVYDYLTSPLCAVAAADIPLAQIITAANVCDEAQSFGARYTINGTVTSDQAQSSVLESMAQAMAGSIVSTTWDVSAGKYVAPVVALLQSDIVGALSITPGVSDASIYNGVKGQYIAPANGYVATDFKPYQNAAYRFADGRDLYTNIDFQFSDSLQRAHNLARIFTEDQRNGFTIKAEFSLKAWPLKVGQRATFTSAFIGQAAKVYRITDKSFSPSSAVELTLKEDAASIWDFADEVLIDATPNTNLPDPWAIAELGSLTCVSGDATLLLQADGSIVSRILATWPAATTQAVIDNGQIEIEHQDVTGGAWNKTLASGNETSAYLTPVSEGWFYVVRARTVNPYLNTKSNWIYTVHQAMGKAERPPVVTGFSVRVIADGTRQFTFNTADQPVDVRSGGGYKIKSRAWDSVAGWSEMVPLHDGIITQSPYETRNPRDGLYDFAILSVDSSGNESSTAALFENFPIGDVDFLDAKSVTSQTSDTIVQTIAALNAKIAANKAETAQATADAAMTAITGIASDGVLSSGEKSEVVLKYDAILAAQAGIDAQATLFAQSSVAYDAAITALTAYLVALSPAYNDMATDTVIVGATFRQKFLDVYSAQQALENAIAAKAKTLADAAQGTANTAVANAATALTAANAANTALTNIASDGILSPSEKPPVVQNYTVITGEKAGIDAQATAYAITTEKTAYGNAVTALTTYLGTIPGWNTVPGSDVVIVGATFRAKFADVYTTKQTLLNAIASKAGTLASWAGLVGVSGTLNSGNIGTVFAGGAVGTAQMADLAVNTAKLSDYSATKVSSIAQNLLIPIGQQYITSVSLAFSTIGRGVVNFSVTGFVSNSGAQEANPTFVVYVDGISRATYPTTGSSFMPPSSSLSFTVKFTLALAAGDHTCYATFRNTIAGTGVVPLETGLLLATEEIKV